MCIWNHAWISVVMSSCPQSAWFPVQSWLLKQAGSGSAMVEKVHLASSFFRKFITGYLKSPKQ